MTAPTRDEVIKMAREAQVPDPMVFLAAYERLVTAAYARGVTDERKSTPHTLGPGEMELSLRREHGGKLLEKQHRFSHQQVVDGPRYVVEKAEQMIVIEIAATRREKNRP